MKYDPRVLRRRSIRLKDYDYASAGAYSVTIVVQQRLRLLGDIVNDEMRLNDAGRMVENWWIELNRKFADAKTDEYVVMPNHFHGIIVIVGGDLRVGPDASAKGAHASGAHLGAPLPTTVQWFKTMTTNAYIRGVKQLAWPPFPGRLWQRNYYEHIIRNETSLARVRAYIQDNPLQWALDDENADRTGA